MTGQASEQSIFLHVLGLPSAADRAAYLDEVCRGNPGLRTELDALLAAHDRLGGGLPLTAGQEPAGVAAAEAKGTGLGGGACDGVGSVLSGRYELVELIGEGGMGTVWLAQQTEPVRRSVALKLVKSGMDTRAVLARFGAERQALAVMDHPNIAKVLDAGVTPAGRPYFVMELVKGMPITHFCDEHRLTPQQRLELFVQVCHAVQHAHQKGIIHRDLKPSNVLVSSAQGETAIKVIDFGIAKATGETLTETTLVTGVGMVVGTPEYMSPEQAELNNADIDTRSDIYSLGVLLYELLTGTTPLTRKRLKDEALLEVLRLVREEEPERPSTRLTATDELPSIAAVRGVDPVRLSRMVRGELDWIVMKALEKDRDRRYETANGLAMDIQRYLVDEPVQACPPSVGYRLRKFSRRNKAALAFTGLVLFIFALSGAGIGWVVRDRAARQTKVASDLELALDRAEEFLKDGRRTEALAALDRADFLSGQFQARGERLSALKDRLAAETRDRVFIDRFEEIRLQVQSQVDVEESRFSGEDYLPEIRKAFVRFGIEPYVMAPALAAACVQGRPEPVRRSLVAALDECLRREPAREAESRDWLLAVLDAADNDVWRTRVRREMANGDATAQKQLAREADVGKQLPSFLISVAKSLPIRMRPTRLDLLRRVQAAYPADLWANHDLAKELEDNGRPAEAIRYYTAAIALRPANPGIYVNRGMAFKDAGEFDAAIADFRRSIALAPNYSKARYNLGVALKAKGLLDEAIAEYREAARPKPDDPEAHYGLGVVLATKGLTDEAIAEFHTALRLKPDYPKAHIGLGDALGRRGLTDEAIAEGRKAIRLKPDDDHAYYHLGKTLLDAGRPEEAMAEFRAALRIRKDHFDARYFLGNALKAQRLEEEAIAEYRKVIRLKPDHAEAHCNLGICLRQTGEVRQALEELRLGHDLGSRRPDWSYASLQWVRDCEQLVELDEKLPGILAGTATPAGPEERIKLARLCSLKRLHRAAARFYEDAFAGDPKLAKNLKLLRDAACAAAQAGCGQSQKAETLDEEERALLRRQALGWLRANLRTLDGQLENEADRTRHAGTVATTMRNWLADQHYAGVRGPEALARLPDSERQPWQDLWDHVRATLAHAMERTTPQRK